ncbi:mediator of RNA polymerase II transcription subunit 10-like isoform X2 [Dendroctonus ponderosae]|uniref:mediator of RNA polymerase II transcription subunit 10-like isoform X2 n=1 Tax=Dendroctonus ponderosae TaxID=77166 RepID=UPI002035A071|nr:mediator of RNA polymerase II transcription subunit 10-like isoform X2 [Dendroctonus ponderosae]
MDSSFKNLEAQLEMLIENARQMHIIVSDFHPQSQNALNQKLQSMVHGLQEVDKLKSQFQDVHVPLEVFDYIDQGRNPKLYTKNCIEKALAKNEQVKGKIDAYRKLKTNLIVELEKIFPNEISEYIGLSGPDVYVVANPDSSGPGEWRAVPKFTFSNT